MIREEVNHPDWEFPFVLYRPEAKMNNYPVIVQLHGAGEVGNGGDDLIRVEVHGISKLIQKGEEYPCMIVMPQCPTESFWAAEIPNIYAFINRLIETYSIDTGRIYLTGLSMGGFGTWLTACRYPKMFAAIAPVCGGGMTWRVSALDMPIWAWHGTEDEVVYPTETINMVHALRQARPQDPSIRMTLVDGVGHNVWDNAYQQELIQWLLCQHR